MKLFKHDCGHFVLDTHTHDLLHTIVHNQEIIISNQEKIMGAQAELDAALTTIEASVQKLGTDQAAAITDLEAKIAASGVTVDLAPEIARLQAIGTSLAGFDAAATAADPGSSGSGTGSTPAA